MKLVRFCLTVTSLSALTACNSNSAFYRFTHRQPKPACPACVAPGHDQPAAVPQPAPTPPVVEKTPPPPAAEPVAPAAPAVVAPVAAVAPTPAPAAPALPAVAAPGLKVTRTGQQVHLAWTLPISESGYRSVEIMRNTSETPKGRTRIKTVRYTVTEIDDTVENATTRYWYWLKVTDQNTNITNLGPVEAVEAAH